MALFTESSTGSRIAWIDSLRGYAILAVMAYHAAQELPSLGGFPGKALGVGSIGVQLFFMVSAFTIFHTLEEARARGRLSWRAFYVRRALRILPLFYLVLILEAVLRLASGGGFPWAEFLATLTFASAWIPSLCPTLVPGGWSIAVEMCFYALAPLLFRAVNTLPRALLFALAALVLRVVLNEGLARGVDDPPVLFPDFLFYWLPNQLPLFALGILAWLAWRGRAAPDGLSGAGVPGAGLGNRDVTERRLLAAFLLLASLYLLAATVQGFKALLPFHVLGGMGFLLLMLHLAEAPGSPVANRAMAALGRVSFGAYLVHFYVLRRTAPGFLSALADWPMPPALRFASLLAWTVALAWAGAWILHRAVERPCQALGRTWARRFEGG